MEQNIQSILSHIRNIWDILVKVKKDNSTNTTAISNINDTISNLASVATSGDYGDLINTPTIPTVPSTLSSFTDDLGTSPVHTHSQYLTGISNTDVIDALGYTPADSSNLVAKAGDTMSGTLQCEAKTGIKYHVAADDTTTGASVFFRFDGNNFYILKTAAGDADGDWDATRPLTISIADGALSTITPSNNSNSTRVATTEFVRNTTHGEWIASNYTIMEDVSLNGSTNLTYTLSSYLPHDDNTYEVLIACRTTATSTGFTDLQISALNSYMYGGYSSKGVLASSSSTLLAKYNTNITVRRNTNWHGTASIYCRAYRRVSY